MQMCQFPLISLGNSSRMSLGNYLIYIPHTHSRRITVFRGALLICKSHTNSFAVTDGRFFFFVHVLV